MYIRKYPVQITKKGKGLLIYVFFRLCFSTTFDFVFYAHTIRIDRTRTHLHDLFPKALTRTSTFSASFNPIEIQIEPPRGTVYALRGGRAVLLPTSVWGEVEP